MNAINLTDHLMLLSILIILVGGVISFVVWKISSTQKCKSCKLKSDLRDQLHLPTNEISSILTHEITQPVASALISAQAAVREMAGAKLDHSKVIQNLNRSVTALRKTNEIINRFRLLIHQGAFKLQIEDLDCNKLIEEVLEIIQPLAQQKMVELIYIKNSTNLNIKGDRLQLSQVLVNLLTNAIDAASSNKLGKAQVKIQLIHLESGLEISISDTGSGFDSVLLKSAGQPFITNKTGGLGLGLPIAKQIISKHQGDLSWDNLADGGACLRIFLPKSF